MTPSQTRLLAAVGVSPDDLRPVDLHKTWISYGSKLADSKTPVIFVEKGPPSITEVKKAIRQFTTCLVLIGSPHDALILKVGNRSDVVVIKTVEDYERITAILQSCEFATAITEFRTLKAFNCASQKLHTATRDFDNRGLFENHYLKERVWRDARVNVGEVAERVVQTEGDVWSVLEALGWSVRTEYGTQRIDDAVSITVTPSDNLSIRKTDNEVAPSYLAVDALKHSTWSILTNGREWRLYSARMSASTTNYFAVVLNTDQKYTVRYLAAVFGSSSYALVDKRRDIDTFFEKSREYARDLEDDLSSRIMSADGPFLHIVKGLLAHDKKKSFSDDELEDGRRAALKTMYRIWFILYAESRDLLPTNDTKYRIISLQAIRRSLNEYESRSGDTDCWDGLLRLFRGIRCGSKTHNLPQYDGDLFKSVPQIDSARVKNGHIVKALKGLLEQDGATVDYASLNVRHLGSVYETLMEYKVKQAKRKIMLVEQHGTIREISTKQSGAYSYEKNDLYLVSGGGIALRKSTASYYTPDEMVRFLVSKCLDPVLAERENLLAVDMPAYLKDPSDLNRRTCMDRLLDIQVLDPAMGSGHFLVEALSRITEWATRMLKEHPEHPLLTEIDCDRRMVVEEQRSRGIAIDQSQLTDDVLLKRRVMKRCIFGVDLNPLAVELCKLSLWLDSFAIGVPLTYLNHHIKHGDSTIGMWRADMVPKRDAALDDYMTETRRVGDIMANISYSADVTVDAVHSSEDAHIEYEKRMTPHKAALDALAAFAMDGSIIRKHNPQKSARWLSQVSEGKAKLDDQTRRIRDKVNDLKCRYSFFHWELEMMDAFTDERWGFDCVVGNFPWEKSKANDKEFFTSHDPSFTSLKTKPEKEKRKKTLFIENPELEREYVEYKQTFADKSAFYKQMFKMQGTGDRDMWQLVLERVLGPASNNGSSRRLVSDDGTVSVLLPSGLLTGRGALEMRRRLLDLDIRQLYVFENKGIFSIDSRYRLLLMTVRNRPGPDEFHAGFFLHKLKSLEDPSLEKDKFTYRSKKNIRTTSHDLVISEVTQDKADVSETVSSHNSLPSCLGDGWEVEITSGLHRTSDSDLFRTDGKGWPVVEGKNMHQFNHAFSHPRFTILHSQGLKKLSSKKIYGKRPRDFYDSYQLVFRNISHGRNMRTVIATILPPRMFYPNSLYVAIPIHNGSIELGSVYNRHIAYLVGVFNSMTFDFLIRSKVNTNVASVIKDTPVPRPTGEIAELAARLSVGSNEFESFAESLRIDNLTLCPSDKIKIRAKLDATVAHAYGLNKGEYRMVLNSFKFREDSSLHEAENVNWSDNETLKKFYGEVRKLALAYYDEMYEGRS